MAQTKDSSTKSLFVTLFIVGSFLAAVIFIQTPQNPSQVEKIDSVFAGSEDPVDTTVTPVATMVPVATKTPIPTIKPSVTATASATPAATFFLPVATPIVEQSPTPVPTFSLDLPGDTTETQTPAPVAQTNNAGSNNMLPIIIAAVVGLILVIAGVVLFILKKKKDDDGFRPPNTPTMPPAPPFQQPTNQGTSGQGQTNEAGFSTPYDQYISNQPNQK